MCPYGPHTWCSWGEAHQNDPRRLGSPRHSVEGEDVTETGTWVPEGLLFSVLISEDTLAHTIELRLSGRWRLEVNHTWLESHPKLYWVLDTPLFWCKRAWSIKKDSLEQFTRSRSAQVSPMCWPCKWMGGARFSFAGLRGVERMSTVACVSALCLYSFSLLGAIIWKSPDYMNPLAFLLAVWPWMSSFNSLSLSFPTCTPGIKNLII